MLTCILPFLFSSSHSLTPPTPLPNPPPSLFRKGQASSVLQESRASQAAVRLNTFYCIQAGQGNPAEE